MQVYKNSQFWKTEIVGSGWLYSRSPLSTSLPWEAAVGWQPFLDLTGPGLCLANILKVSNEMAELNLNEATSPPPHPPPFLFPLFSGRLSLRHTNNNYVM